MGKSISGRGAVARIAFPAILFCALLLAVQSAKADTFTFNDVSDPVSVNHVGNTTGNSDTTSIECSSESSCQLVSAIPPGAGTPTGIHATDFSGGAIYIADPNGISISDKLLITFVGTSAYEILFSSDDSGTGASFGTCAADPIHSCQYTENGATQFASTITWTSGGIIAFAPARILATDTIQFSSIADATVPEPNSLALLLAGVCALGMVAVLARVPTRSTVLVTQYRE